MDKGVKTIYLGESHRTWGDRQREHEQAIRKLDQSYATVKHTLEDHPGEAPRFKFEVIRGHKSAIERQIWEA